VISSTPDVSIVGLHVGLDYRFQSYRGSL